MLEYQFTKQAFKKLKQISKADKTTANRIKKIILNLAEDPTLGESLQGYSEFKKNRIGKYRIIHTLQNKILLIAIIEKRETIYQTFKHLINNSETFK